jgi:exonuclease SbcD
MKFLHISDLHIGRKLGERSLLADQAHVLAQIFDIVRRESVDALLIAGDVYDRSAPSVEAITLFEDFLTKLAGVGTPVFIIYGNHDSAERLSYGNEIFALHNIHITSPYEGEVPEVILEDEFGPVHIYLLPNLKISAVRQYFDGPVETLDDAARCVLDGICLNEEDRNIIVAHQFVSFGQEKPAISDSEVVSVGDIEEISAGYFARFDYAALGHLHKAQKVYKDSIRYSGSPLKYSKSEKDHVKSATLVTMGKKGDVAISEIPLEPLHDVREIRGKLALLISREVVELGNANDFIYVTLTDETPDAETVAKIANAYPNFVKIEREAFSGSQNVSGHTVSELEKLDPLEVFSGFFEKQTGAPLNEREEEIVREILAQIREEAS